MSQYRRSGRHRYQHYIYEKKLLIYCLNTAEAVDIGTYILESLSLSVRCLNTAEAVDIGTKT